MKRNGVVLFLFLSCIVFGSSYKLPEENEALDAAVGKPADRLGVEAIQVGQVLRAISHGLRDTAKSLEREENQVEQYFFNKIVNIVKAVGSGAADVAKAVGKTVESTIQAVKSFYSAKGQVTSQAADILRKLIVKDISLYALEDGKTYKDFRQHVADDLSRVAESLIKTGEALCSCRGHTQLDEIEAKFVQVVVEAF